jgi:hypothetical protein
VEANLTQHWQSFPNREYTYSGKSNDFNRRSLARWLHYVSADEVAQQ